MRWIRRLSAETGETAEVVGGKAHGLVALHRLGLPVPAGFVVTAEACREYLRDGCLPDGLEDELRRAMSDLETATGRDFGGVRRPLAVSVRSGASVSMPGMMDTILNLGLTAESTAALAAETGDERFALSSRERFLAGFAAAIGDGRPIPDDAARQLALAVRTVFSSWDAPRAQTYRELHGIPHHLGTAVIVQAMVFGNRDDRSGTGVAFSRDPNTGANVPFGEVLFGRQGEEVVSGGSRTRPLRELADREPAVWAALLDALSRIEGHYRDACYVEFTFEAGVLWLLQARPGRFDGAAAVRLATDLVDERVIGRGEALLRVSPQHLRHVRTPRIVAGEADVLARGLGACPGVATGRVATTSDSAVRMAADGPVVLVRPETSPHDLRGLAAAAGIVTARGGPASHAAVVARAMGKPAVVGVADLVVDAGSVSAGGRTIGAGTLVTIDGTGGEVVLGDPGTVTPAADAHLRRLLGWADDVSGDHNGRTESERLGAAHAVLRGASGRRE
ncbi:pyruvate, orthophosphate dikinase [Lentzea xinjiangensis]|uniref:Pyruvate, orthophosphate dikinase n=1 Tax=Lentzea xinjiangensis TaxID=402600 RepID=A0A1H9UG19_9PSEU|nr:pyruvate, phosphate dikinase [Lentzea xinjiangensis]SES08480.1 pyruvate, orthophosphate dikinase [Lentzea xinjiangensis]